MTTHEFAQFVLGGGTQTRAEPIDEAAVKEVAQLVSGSLIYRLYESLITNDYNMDEVTEHLEMLSDTGNSFGLPHLTIHALRHTYATTVLNAGVAAQNVARLLGHKDGATTLKFYAHYINTEAITQLEKLEQQNVNHLGITAAELERITMGAKDAISKCSVAEQIDEAVLKSKNLPPKKSVEQVLSVCEGILCQPKAVRWRASRISRTDR